MTTIYHKCLGRFGYIVRKDQLTAADEVSIKADLTVKTAVLPAYADFQKPKIYKIYMHSRLAYYLPRFYGIGRFGPPEYCALTKGVSIKARCIFQPLSHQKRAFEKGLPIFNPKLELGGGGVLQLPCGYGKTFYGIRTGSDVLKLATIIFVPQEILMDQWVEAIERFVPDAKVGYIQRDHIDVEGKDFVVAMIHSVCLKDYPVTTFDRFGFAIFDECHHLGSEFFCKAMSKVRTRFVLGLSATPNRRDGLSHVFYKFLGPMFHREKRTGCNVVHIKKVKLHSNDKAYNVLRMNNAKRTKNTGAMTTAISGFEERNVLIIHMIRDLIAQGRKILLLSSRIPHLYRLKELLDEAAIKHPCTGKYATYGFYHGKRGMSKKNHKALLAKSSKCDVVMGIDMIAKEGLDIPDLNTLIFATPSGMDVEQPVGRILRKFHTDINPLVIDLVDNTGNYVNHSRERVKWYKEEEYIIHEGRAELNGDPNMWKEDITDYLQKVTSYKVTKDTKTYNSDGDEDGDGDGDGDDDSDNEDARKRAQKEKECTPQEMSLTLPDETDLIARIKKDQVKIARKKRVAIVRKAQRVQKAQKAQGSRPSLDKCLLSGSTAILKKTKPKPKTAPNFNLNMLQYDSE